MTIKPPQKEKLVRELRRVANIINAGEKIRWGQETALMDKAANALEALHAKEKETCLCKDKGVIEMVEEAYQAGRDEATEIIKEELRNAPLEVQMTKGVIFGKIIKALQDNK